MQDAAKQELSENNYISAVRSYEKATVYCALAQRNLDLAVEQEGEFEKLKIACMLRRSLCFFMLSEFTKSFDLCARVFNSRRSCQKNKMEAIIRMEQCIFSLSVLTYEQGAKEIPKLFEAALDCAENAKIMIGASSDLHGEFDFAIVDGWAVARVVFGTHAEDEEEEPTL